MIIQFRKGKDMKNILLKDKISLTIIGIIVLFSDLGLPGLIHIIKYSDNIYRRLSEEPQYMLHTILLVGEFIILITLLVYLIRILYLAKILIINNSLVSHMNKIIYILLFGGVLSMLHDTLIKLDTGILVMNMPVSGRSLLIFICMVISYIVRYICKVAVEIKDYQDLTI